MRGPFISKPKTHIFPTSTFLLDEKGPFGKMKRKRNGERPCKREGEKGEKEEGSVWVLVERAAEASQHISNFLSPQWL